MRNHNVSRLQVERDDLNGERSSSAATWRMLLCRTIGVSMVAGLLLSGCAKQPGGQVVAVVGDDEITLTELRAEARTPAGSVGPEAQATNAAALARLVDRNVLAEYARTQGLDRSPDYVARRRQIEQSLLASLAIRKLAGTPPKPGADEVSRFISANPTLFGKRERLDIDRIQIASPSDRATIKALVDLQDLDATEARLVAQKIKFSRGRGVFDTASIDPAVAKQIAALPNGEIFDITSAGSTYISKIVGRTPIVAPPANWTGAAAALVARNQVAAKVEGELDKLRKATKIDYEPAYRPKSASS